MTQPPQNDSPFSNPTGNGVAPTEPVVNDSTYANPAVNGATVTEPAPNNFAYANPAYNTQQAPYGVPAPMQPAKKSAAFAIVALVLAILGLLISWIPVFNFFALGLIILGLIFGIVGLVLAKKGTHGGKGLALAAVIVSVIAVVLVIVSNVILFGAMEGSKAEIEKEINNIEKESSDFEKEMDKLTGDATEDILANSLDVKIGTFEVKEDEIWSETKLPVTITNKLDKAMNFSVTVEAADTDGNRLDTDIVFVDKLAPGQSYSEDIFTYVSDDEIEKYKNATFKVVEATESDY